MSSEASTAAQSAQQAGKKYMYADNTQTPYTQMDNANTWQTAISSSSNLIQNGAVNYKIKVKMYANMPQPYTYYLHLAGLFWGDWLIQAVDIRNHLINCEHTLQSVQGTTNRVDNVLDDDSKFMGMIKVCDNY